MKEVILYFVPSLRSSGPTNQLYELVRNLDLKRFEPVFLTLSKETPTRIDSRFADRGWKIFPLDLSTRNYVLAGRPKVKEAINLIHPAIIHTSGVRCDYLVSRMPEYLDRFCMTIHCSQAENSYGWLLGWILMAMERSAIRFCRYPVACSASLSEYYFKNHGLKTRSIPNGASINQRFSEGSSDARFRVAMVGSLCERKDPLTLIQAFGDLPKENYFLDIFGEGELFERCSEEASDNVMLHGYASDISARLGQTDILVSAAKSEGFPMAVLEAGVSGCYLVLSDIPAHREILDDKEEHGSLFAMGDAEALASVLRNLKLKEVRELREYRAKWFRDKHSSLRMAEQYQMLYEMIIGKRGSRL